MNHRGRGHMFWALYKVRNQEIFRTLIFRVQDNCVVTFSLNRPYFPVMNLKASGPPTSPPPPPQRQGPIVGSHPCSFQHDPSLPCVCSRHVLCPNRRHVAEALAGHRSGHHGSSRLSTALWRTAGQRLGGVTCMAVYVGEEGGPGLCRTAPTYYGWG